MLYFDGCPNWVECGDRVNAAVATANLADVEVAYRRINDSNEAATVPFAGSPTILIDGADAFGGAERTTDMACRVYPTEAGFAGMPTVTQLTAALQRAAAVDGRAAMSDPPRG